MARTPNSKDIEAFNVVAVELSFRQAAERLNIDQSALSRKIRHLEDMIGFQLIRRTTREVSLTEAGRVLHKKTRMLSRQIDTSLNSARAAAEGKSGTLRIAYMSFAAIDSMPYIVDKFSSQYPEVTLELTYMQTQAQKIALSRNDIDVGFMLGPFSHPQFETKTIIKEDVVAILPMNHKLSTRPTVTLSDLEPYPMVLGSQVEWEFFRLFVSDAFSNSGFDINVKFEATNAMGILGLVSGGLGISLYSEGIMKLQPRKIASKYITDFPEKIETTLCWNRAYKTKPLMNFIKIAKEYGKVY